MTPTNHPAGGSMDALPLQHGQDWAGELHGDSQLRENRVVKLIVAAPEDEGIAMLSHVQRRLDARCDMRLNADFNGPDAALREAPLVVFGQSLQALVAGRGYLLLALVADDQGRHQFAAINAGIEHQIPALAILRNQSTLNLHGSSLVITESATGLGIPGEVRCVDNDDAMTRAVAHAMGGACHDSA